MQKKNIGLLLSLGIIVSLAVFSPKKILVVKGYAVTPEQFDRGKAVYNRFCSECHATGRNGAPTPGDSHAWNERLGKGISDVLGGAEGCNYSGTGATLPAGEEFAIAAAYMIATSKGRGDRRPRRRSGARVGQRKAALCRPVLFGTREKEGGDAWER